MTRQHALCRLLEHGALTARELVEITRWPARVVASALWYAAESGRIKPLVKPGTRHYVYTLA